MRKNLARAIVIYAREIVPPTIKVVVSEKTLLSSLTYTVVRDVVKNDPDVLHEVKMVLESDLSSVEKKHFAELLDMLTEIQKQGLVTSLVLPLLLDISKNLYPSTPSDFGNETLEFLIS